MPIGDIRHGQGRIVGMERRLVETLSKVEREVLRAYLTRSEVKEVARALDRSPHTIEQRLARARRKLGVRRSIDAAHMLGRVEGGDAPTMYGLPVYAKTAIADDTPATSKPDLAEEGSWIHHLPFPTKGRPWNDSSIGTRLIAIPVGMLLATASVLLAASLLEVMDRIARQLL